MGGDASSSVAGGDETSSADAIGAASGGRRVVRTTLFGVIALLVVVGMAVVAHAVWTYQPIEFGEMGGYGAIQHGKPLIAKDNGTQAAVTLSSGPFEGTIYSSIVNRGRWGVTIEKVNTPPLLGETGSSVCMQGKGLNDFSTAKCVPFRPFELTAAGTAGEWRRLVISVHFRCVPIGAPYGISIDNYNVTYRFFGFDHTVSIQAAPALVLSGPNRCAR